MDIKIATEILTIAKDLENKGFIVNFNYWHKHMDFAVRFYDVTLIDLRKNDDLADLLTEIKILIADKLTNENIINVKNRQIDQLNDKINKLKGYNNDK
jgi:hypothetical protein